MGLYRGSTEVSKIYRGNAELDKIYRGSSLVWQNVILATVTQSAFTSVSGNALTLNANVTGDGGGTISERGFWFGTSATRTSNTKYTVSGTTGAYNLARTGLSRNTTYYSDAFATNEAGDAFSAQVSGTTPNWIYANASTVGGGDAYMYPSGGPTSQKTGGGSWQPKVVPGVSHQHLMVATRGAGTFLGNFGSPSGYNISGVGYAATYGSATITSQSTSYSVTQTNSGNTVARVYFNLSN